MINTGINNVKPVRDVYADFGALTGELTDEQAKATLAEFLYHNPAFLFDVLGEIKMLPFQEILIKGWSQNDYNMMVASRGGSKSWTVALFILFWAMFNPGCRIVVVSFAFRASRRILEQCEKFINDSRAARLAAHFPDGIERKPDEWKLRCVNGATIESLPLGDGKKIRGIRADVLIADEYGFMPESIIAEVIRPFLAAKGKVREQLTIREREDEEIRLGLKTEEERTVIEDRKKLIFLSSASYSFEHLAIRYNDQIKQLTLNPELETEEYDKFKKSGRGHFICRFSYEAVPIEILDMDEINQARREMSEQIFNKEYGAQFISDSDGFFRASKMIACTVPDGESPCLELVGEDKAEYALGIDQNTSGAETSDHFAMCLMKIVTRPTDGKKIGMVVHSYAQAGCGLKDHMLFLLFLLKRFNIVYIAVDSSSGDELEFLNVCNQSPLFKDHPLHPIEADFKKHEFKEIVGDIRRSYNRTSGRIVQKQPFSSEWQRTANEYLQSCFDHSNVKFAAKIVPNGAVAAQALNVDISGLAQHEGLKGTTISEYIQEQDALVELTKRECAWIQVKISDLGTMSFGLPQNMKRTSGPNRARKDSYSALLIANWGVKMYTESMALPVQTGQQAFEYVAF